MRNYDETVSTVFKKIEEYKIAQKHSKRVMLRIIMPVGSFCIAVLMGVVIWQAKLPVFEPKEQIEDSIAIGKQDSFDDRGNSKHSDGSWYGEGQEKAPSGITNSTSSTESENNSGTAKLLCYINQIESTVNADISGPTPYSEHYAESWDNEKMTAYLGINFSRINELYTLDSYNHGVWYKKADNTLVRDYSNFAYSSEKNSFQISASKLEMPRDCIITTNEEVKETKVGTANGPVKVKFFGTVGTKSEENPEIQAIMIAEFEYKNVYFRVKANEISAFNFYKIVSLIVNG